MGYQLNAEQKLDWQQHGFLKIENLLSDDDKKMYKIGRTNFKAGQKSLESG